MVETAALLLAGFAVLVGGAELLVRGAVRIAELSGLTPLVIGLTVVACGTSAPELAVNVGAAWRGQPDIALGNVVGSNIFNILAILGCSALAAPLSIGAQVIRRELPIMIAAGAGVLVLSSDQCIGRAEGVVLLAALVAYVTYAVRAGRSAAGSAPESRPAPVGPSQKTAGRILRQVVLIVAGLVLLALGTRWVVSGATAMAQAMGVSELVIGLTIVAIGTGLPELATSVLATVRGQRDIAVGNVVGSCIFNLLGILGVSGVLCPLEVARAALWFDLPFMVVASLFCLPLFITGGVLSRREGALFLAYYAAYLAYLVLDAAAHPAFPAYRSVMLLSVVPVTLAVAGTAYLQWARARRAGARN